MQTTKQSPPLNCFFLFCKENRTSVARRYPNLSNSEITSLLGKSWRELKPSEKEKYVSHSAQQRRVSIQNNYFLFNSY